MTIDSLRAMVETPEGKTALHTTMVWDAAKNTVRQRTTYADGYVRETSGPATPAEIAVLAFAVPEVPRPEDARAIIAELAWERHTASLVYYWGDPGKPGATKTSITKTI